MCPTTRWASACLSARREAGREGRVLCSCAHRRKKRPLLRSDRKPPSCLRGAVVGAVGSAGRFWAMRASCLESRVSFVSTLNVQFNARHASALLEAFKGVVALRPHLLSSESG